MIDYIPRKDVKLPPTISEAKLMARIDCFAKTTLAELKGDTDA